MVMVGEDLVGGNRLLVSKGCGLSFVIYLSTRDGGPIQHNLYRFYARLSA